MASSSSSSALLSGTGINPESFPVNENHQNLSPHTEYTSSSSSSTSSRNSSFGSLSFSSYTENSPSPIHSIFTLRNSGVPFSWEQHPGIPKKSSNLSRSSKEQEHSSSSSSSSLILLPLPPASCSNLSKRFSFEALFAIRKKTNIEIIRKDPFIAALMKCSKDDSHDDDDDEEAISDDLCWKADQNIIVKHSKSSSSGHRFGFNIIGCKNSCSVVEPNVLIPKYSRKASYDLLNRRSR